MEKKELIYEGKAKQLFKTGDPDVLLLRYKDQATALDGLKKEDISGKGEFNNAIAALFFQLLEENGVESHFIRQLNEREMLVKKVSIIPVEVVVRNVAAGSMAKRLGIEEGVVLKKPVKEFFLKDDHLHDPLLNHDHVDMLDLAIPEEVEQMEAMALQVNDILRDYLKKLNITLVDFKLEFGRYKGRILLADEVSPDTCRFWDTRTGEKLDKDRFRRDMGGLLEAYQEVLNRLKGEK
jgi:phosphoribosylaminoimidazole-succinocarboxamide synthase